jgi:hypothetical protein
MQQLLQLLLGGGLAVLGGLLGARYQQRLTAHAERRERFRGVYHALLSSAWTARNCARLPLDDALAADGAPAEWWLRRQERELAELTDVVREARKHASWLDFETDVRSIEGRLRFATLDWSFATLATAHERFRASPGDTALAELSAAARALEDSADDLARAIRLHMAQLELPAPLPRPRVPRRTARRQRSEREGKRRIVAFLPAKRRKRG